MRKESIFLFPSHLLEVKSSRRQECKSASGNQVPGSKCWVTLLGEKNVPGRDFELRLFMGKKAMREHGDRRRIGGGKLFLAESP
jgi:hypothetical protein